MKASDLMVKCLEEEGIEYIFGVPGEENADFMISLEESSQIKFILTRHEQGAAFMAEIYGRLTGTPAGCLSTLGPGATNLITGVEDANMDRAPMLVLTGQGSTRRLHKESHQIMDVINMFEPVTKWATRIIHADSIPEIIRKAVRIARSEKPGAVLVELPEDIATHDTYATPMKPIRFRRSSANREMLLTAIEKLKGSRRPIILAGNGCIRERSAQYMRELAELTGIGVLNTFIAKGAIDPDSPQSLYTIGLGAKDIATCAIDDADLVLSIGFDMVEYPPSLWNTQGEKSIIHLDFQAAEIDSAYHPEIELVGDIADTLKALLDELKKHGEFNFDLAKQARIRDEIRVELNAHNDDKTSGIIKPQKVLHDVQKVYAEDGLLLSDVGAHKMWIARHYHCKTPNGCLIPNGFCSMGFALPGAIAASIVYPQRKILWIAGDAGFLMNVQEMETAARLNSNITMMVWEDHMYGLIAWKQSAHFGKHTELSFTNPDWGLLAKSFRWDYQFVGESDQLLAALNHAAGHHGPSLIVIPIDYNENQKLTQQLGQLTCTI